MLSGFTSTCRHRRPRAEEAVRLGIEVIRDEALTLRGRSERTRLHTRSGHRKVHAAHSGDYAGTYGFATSTPRRLRPQIDPPPSAQCHGCRLQLSLQLLCVCPRPRRRKATAHVSKRHRARGAARGSPAQRQTSTRSGSNSIRPREVLKAERALVYFRFIGRLNIFFQQNNEDGTLIFFRG